MSDATPSEAGQTVRLEVARTSPDGTDTGRRDVFDVPYDDRTSVLDALQWVKDHADPTLTFRWSCKMAVCGSCGVMVNGRPVLGCETFVRGYRTSGLVVEPLAHAEVLRDLVVDTDTFLGKARHGAAVARARRRDAAPARGRARARGRVGCRRPRRGPAGGR